jgi:hypothetical protein
MAKEKLPDVRVKPRPEGGWEVTKDGRHVSDHRKKDPAVDRAREVAKQDGGSVRIHKEDGKIQEERTFPRERDPKRSPG